MKYQDLAKIVIIWWKRTGQQFVGEVVERSGGNNGLNFIGGLGTYICFIGAGKRRVG